MGAEVKLLQDAFQEAVKISGAILLDLRDKIETIAAAANGGSVEIAV